MLQDVESLAKLLLTVLVDDRLRQKLAIAARATALQFAPSIIADRSVASLLLAIIPRPLHAMQCRATRPFSCFMSLGCFSLGPLVGYVSGGKPPTFLKKAAKRYCKCTRKKKRHCRLWGCTSTVSDSR